MRLKVLYIAGNGRSGSTLLDNIMGQMPGFFSVGEARAIWDEGIVRNLLCGCGQTVTECEVWSEVLNEMAPGGEVDGRHMARLREQLAQTKQLARMIAVPQQYHQGSVPGLDEFLEMTGRLYRAIARITRCNVIVDSSKWPSYGFLLSLIPCIDVYVLHLVRDPRACAFSWRRVRESEPGRQMATQNIFHSTAYWTVWNPAIRHLWRRRLHRYRFLRYEDFMQNPRKTIPDIVDFLNEPVQELPFVGKRAVSKARTHSISGNPAKFTSGTVDLVLDDEWQRKMPWIQRLLVTFMTWPMLWKYGYFSGKRPTGID